MPPLVPPRPALVIAWSGALVFVSSLVFFLYSYLTRFSAAAADSLPAPLLINVAIFSGFALHHSVCARPSIKGRIQRIVPAYLERSAYTWIASLLFAAVCWWWRPLPGVLYGLTPPAAWIGFGVQASGILLLLLGSKALDMLDLAGVRPVLLAGTGTNAAHVPLKTSGVYGLVRHPVYLGWTLFVFGAPHMTATRFVFAVSSCAYLALAVPLEERSLIQTFGSDYEAYRRQVRWRMWPGLY